MKNNQSSRLISASALILFIATTLLSPINAQAADSDAKSIQSDIDLIAKYYLPSADPQTLQSICTLEQGIINKLRKQAAADTVSTDPDQLLKTLQTSLGILAPKTQQALSSKSTDVDEILRLQFDAMDSVMNRFYVTFLRNEPGLEGLIVFSLEFSKDGYVEQADIQNAAPGMEKVGRTLLPLMYTIRIRPQDAPLSTTYPVHLFKGNPPAA